MSEERAKYRQGVYVAPEANEFRHLLSVWKLTGAAAGELAGVSGRQIRRYTGGEQRLPYAVLFTLAMKNEGVMISIDRWREELQTALRASIGERDQPATL